MSAFTELLAKTLPVFIVLALGMLCRKTGLLRRDNVNALKSVAVNICLPAVMFSAFATADYSRESIFVPLIIFALCIAALVLGFAACRIFRIPGRLTPYLSAGFEAGMLGYALFALLFPGEKTSEFAMIDLGQVLFVFTVYKALLAQKNGVSGVLKEAVSSPIIWAIAAGLLFGATGLYTKLQPSGISSVIDAATSFMSAPTSVLILLGIGFDFVPSEIRWKNTGAFIALRLAVSAVMLGAALLIDRFILGGMVHTGALILMFILPPPYVLPVFSDVEDERADISSALSALTLITIILFAVLAAIY